MRLKLLLSLLVLSAVSAGPVQQCVITDFGAIGDGKTVNTKAIQSVIDRLAKGGGGVVIVPAGTFVSGALFFKQGVDLLVQKDGVLKGTTNQADYPLVSTRWEGVEGMHTSAFLNFDDMTGVTLSGDGTIDGSGDSWPRGFGRGRRFGGGTTRPTTNAFGRGFGRGFSTTTFVFQQVGRPRLVCFKNCSDVHISDIHLKRQAIWCLHLLYCNNVVVNNVNIRSVVYIPSSDGIDVDSSRDVLIHGCDIACTDDDISIKSGKDDDGRRVNRPSENVVIEDCTFGTGEGVAMGSEVTGSIHHVLVQRCTFNGSNTGARIKSQPSRGGEIDDIVFRDIKLVNVRSFVEFLMDWDMRLSRARPAANLTDVHNVVLENYTGTARTGGVIHGLSGGPIRDVKFINCNVSAPSGLMMDHADQIDTSGLNLKVAHGPMIIFAAPATQPFRNTVGPGAYGMPGGYGF
jgi:exo-poly-alpha-galacturonosidase